MLYKGKFIWDFYEGKREISGASVYTVHVYIVVTAEQVHSAWWPLGGLATLLSTLKDYCL